VRLKDENERLRRLLGYAMGVIHSYWGNPYRHWTDEADAILKGEQLKCTWTQNDDGVWDTGCLERFEIMEGTPADNNMRFCHGCARPIEVKT
jgi:hypothetical protein